MDPLKASVNQILTQSVGRQPAASHPAMAPATNLSPGSQPRQSAALQQVDQLTPLQKQAAGQASQAIPFLDKPQAPQPPSQAEIAWALDIEQRVQRQGYEPSAAESKAYEDIALRLQATRPTAPVASAPQPASRAEVKWALDLETQVRQGYQPSPQEVQQYQSIVTRLRASDQVQPNGASSPPGISQAEAQWATELLGRVQQGYQPSEAELARYTEIYQRMAAASDIPPPPSQQELDWARQLETQVRQGYQASPQEMEAYTEIYQRNQSQQASQPGVRHVSHDDLKWAVTLQQRANMGYHPTTQELARYSDIMRCLEHTNPPPAEPAQGSLSQYELDWAATLQERVQTGYQPNPAEAARYQEIYQRFAR